jgi:rRNA maturation endonuclease Nob1
LVGRRDLLISELTLTELASAIARRVTLITYDYQMHAVASALGTFEVLPIELRAL